MTVHVKEVHAPEALIQRLWGKDDREEVDKSRGKRKLAEEGGEKRAEGNRWLSRAKDTEKINQRAPRVWHLHREREDIRDQWGAVPGGLLHHRRRHIRAQRHTSGMRRGAEKHCPPQENKACCHCAALQTGGTLPVGRLLTSASPLPLFPSDATPDAKLMGVRAGVRLQDFQRVSRTQSSSENRGEKSFKEKNKNIHQVGRDGGRSSWRAQSLPTDECKWIHFFYFLGALQCPRQRNLLQLLTKRPDRRSAKSSLSASGR